MEQVILTPEEQAEMELWYVETQERNWKEQIAEWTDESYAQAAIDAHIMEAYSA